MIKKQAFADEVLVARQQSQEAIKAAQASSAEVVQDARSRAEGEVNSINENVIASRRKAEETIQAAQLKSAEAVKEARDQAAKELERIRNRLEEAKTIYSDEIASAREKFNSRIIKNKRTNNRGHSDGT